MSKKLLISSILTITICLSLIVGATYALFTDEDSVNVAVTSGDVNVTANLSDSSLITWSLNQTEADGRSDGSFVNGGLAEITDEASIRLLNMTPGDVAKFTIEVTNTSNVHVKYRVRMISEAGDDAIDLSDALNVTAQIDGQTYTVGGTENATEWTLVEKNADIGDITVKVEFPDRADNNDFKNAQTSITFVVEAVQSNGR